MNKVPWWKELHEEMNVKLMAPRPYNDPPYIQFHLVPESPAIRRPCYYPDRSGIARTAHRVFFETTKGMLSLPVSAARSLEAAIQQGHDQGIEPKDMRFQMQRVGSGIHTRYITTVSSSVDAGYLGQMTQEIAEEIDREILKDMLKKDEDYFIPKKPAAAAKPVCRCDIRDLLSTGHTKGCPEKKK